MTITNHFFRLIQCYSEVGDCRIGEFSFNIMLMTPLYFLIIIVIIGCLYALWLSFRKFFCNTPVEPEQVLDSIYSQGESQ
jgi:hypothetical protein